MAVALAGILIALSVERLISSRERADEYAGETAEYVKLSTILKRGSITEEEETWLFEVAQHHPYMSGEPKFATLVNDMIGSLTNRYDLTGTRYWKAKTGDKEMIDRRRSSCPRTSWGYDPHAPADDRLKSLHQLLQGDPNIDETTKSELVRIVVYEDDYHVSALAARMTSAWEHAGTLKEMPEYRSFLRAEERRALRELFEHHAMIKDGVLQSGDTNNVFAYDPLEEDPSVRRMAVKRFVDFYLTRGDNPALTKIPWQAISILTMIHYWDDNLNVSKAAWGSLHPFPDITICMARTKEEFSDKNSYGVPPFPWSKIGRVPPNYNDENVAYYGLSAPAKKAH